MTATQFRGGALSNGLTSRNSQLNTRRTTRSFSQARHCEVGNYSTQSDRTESSCADRVRGYHLSARHKVSLSPLVTRHRKPSFRVANSQCSSDCDVDSFDAEGRLALEKEKAINGSTEGVVELNGIPISQSYSPDIKREFVMLSLPAFAGQALEPFAQLMETAYIGRLGAVELGSAGVSITVFNIISKLFNIPLLSVATSFVAEDISKNAIKEEDSLEQSNNSKLYDKEAERKQLSSVSTALLLAVGLGIFEALALYMGSGLFLDLIGVSSASSMRIPAQHFLSLRALGAPAVVVTLAIQGILRGFKDTKTPVLCLGIGNLSAVFLFPVLMYYFQLGVTGAAISTVLSQYVVTLLMIWYLNKRAVLWPLKIGALQFGGYLKSGGYLIGRTLAVLSTMTLGTSMAARQGPVAMAAHQICYQVWLAVSLLADALATSAQALIASSISKGDHETVRDVTNFVLKIGLLAGVFLAVILGISFNSLATLFTKDTNVLGIVRTGTLFVSASQPINALAFIFDGLHYGVSDFPYAAKAMMLVGAISSAFFLYVPPVTGLPGVWWGLTLFMGLRMVAGFVRLQSKTGPWWFMHREFHRTEVG